MRTQGTVKTPISAIKKYQAPDPASEERERLILEHCLKLDLSRDAFTNDYQRA